MKIPFINYQNIPPLVNFLYAIEKGFLGYEKKLNKEEKCLLKAKLIWKRKKIKKK
jgi:hypothetical protein